MMSSIMEKSQQSGSKSNQVLTAHESPLHTIRVRQSQLVIGPWLALEGEDSYMSVSKEGGEGLW